MEEPLYVSGEQFGGIEGKVNAGGPFTIIVCCPVIVPQSVVTFKDRVYVPGLLN